MFPVFFSWNDVIVSWEIWGLSNTRKQNINLIYFVGRKPNLSEWLVFKIAWAIEWGNYDIQVQTMIFDKVFPKQ